jgi:4-amino-4-deoxychorismate lyase
VHLHCGESCDDILILQNGYLTDASYANLAFFDGKIWYTPRTPLLAGVRRQFLLDSGRIQTADIRKDDLPSFTSVSLINAMIDLDLVTVPVSRILG